MKFIAYARAASSLIIASTLCACGGGGGESAPSTPITLKASQEAYESLSVSPSEGSFELSWNFSMSEPPLAGINYAYSQFCVLANSPLAGPQLCSPSVPDKLTNTLILNLAPAPQLLRNGKIVPVLQPANSRVSYVDSYIKVEVFAADNATVAYTELHADYVYQPLTGLLSASPAEFKDSFATMFANPKVFKPDAAYGENAGYLKYVASNLGDRYTALSCGRGAANTPCMSEITLEAFLTQGFVSAEDNKRYVLSDGSINTVDGVKVWVATAARPLPSNHTTQYRIFFELNGNVHTGSLIKNGAVLSGASFRPYHVRLNKAARDSIAAAMAI